MIYSNPSNPQAYIKEVAIGTGGIGIGIALLLGLVLFFSWIFCLCRCKKIEKRDKAIEAGVFNGDKHISQLYPYHDVEVAARKQRKVLWFGTFVLLLGYAICAGVAYKTVKNSKGVYDKVILGADTLLGDVQGALCTAEMNDSGNVDFGDCNDGSIGDFLSTIKQKVGRMFDDGVDIIQSLGESITHVQGFQDTMSDIDDSLVSMEGSLDVISTNLTVLESSLGVANPLLDPSSQIEMPSINVPPEVTGQLQNARSVVGEAIDMLQEMETDIQQTMVDDNSQVGRFRLMIDDIPGNELDGDSDLRSEVMEVLKTGDKEIKDIIEMTSDFRSEQLGKLNKNYDSQFHSVSLLAFALLALPGVLLLLLSMCAAIIKSPKPFYCSMAFSFFTLGIYCLLGGLCLLLVKITTDGCDNIDTLLLTNLRDEFEFVAPNGKTIQSPPLGEAAIALYQCRGRVGDNPDETNNYIGILGLGEFFDISDMLSPATDAVNNIVGKIEGQGGIAEQLKEPINGIPEEFDFDVDSALQSCTHATEETEQLLSELPPSEFDRDDPEQVALFENYYMTGANPLVAFTWNTALGDVYSSNVEQLSLILKAMQQTNDIIGCNNFDFDEFSGRIDTGDPHLSYNFIRDNLDGVKYCDPLSGAFISTNDADGDYSLCTLYTGTGFTGADVCGNTGYMTQVSLQTAQINVVDGINTQFVDAVTEAAGAVSNIKDGVNLQKLEMDNIVQQKGHLNTLVDGVDAFFSNVRENVLELKERIVELNDVVGTVDQYSMCGYLGDAYTEIVEEALCTNMVEDVRALAVLILVVVMTMFVGFCFHGIYATSLRKRIVPGGTRSRDFDKGIVIEDTTPPVSPSEIVSLGREYSHFEQPILISPQFSFDFEKPPPISPGSDHSSCMTEPASPHPLL